jgi:hypothetical protein
MWHSCQLPHLDLPRFAARKNACWARLRGHVDLEGVESVAGMLVGQIFAPANKLAHEQEALIDDSRLNLTHGRDSQQRSLTDMSR